MRKSIFHEKIGEAGGRQKMWGGVGGAGAPPTNMFGFKSPSGDLKPNRNTKTNRFLESSSLESSSLETCAHSSGVWLDRLHAVTG